MSDITLAWKRRTLVCTGPATFYVAVPIVGLPPDPGAAYELVAELQEACRNAAPSNGTTVRAVRGRVTFTPGAGHALSIYVTVRQGSGDPHRDGAYVAWVLRNAARRARAGFAPVADTSPLQRVPAADHRNPNDPPPAAPTHAPLDEFLSATFDRQRQLGDPDAPPSVAAHLHRAPAHRSRRRPWTAGS